VSYTPFAAPILSGLLADEKITKLFSIREELETMIAIEGALTLSQAKTGIVPEDAAQAIMNALSDFEPSLQKISEATAIDGVVVPELVRQIRDHVGAPHNTHIHFGATSQDIIDTSLVLRLRECIKIYRSRIGELLTLLETHAKQFENHVLVGRTRMQAAKPITVANKIENWAEPLRTSLERLGELEPRLLVLQFGGAVGTLDELGEKAKEVSAFLAADLKLNNPDKSWHTDRSSIAEFASWLSLVTGALGKIGTDIALMAQNEISEIKLSGGGSSSSMPHKQNPVKAEALVSLARFNAAQLAGIHHALVHEQERSGAAWTLEWMLLPQMCVATGAATRQAIALLNSIETFVAQKA